MLSDRIVISTLVIDGIVISTLVSGGRVNIYNVK